MVRIRGLGRALGRVIRRALGRKVSRDANDAPNCESPQHPYVGNGTLHLLLRMFTIWIMWMKRSMNSLKKQLLMM